MWILKAFPAVYLVLIQTLCFIFASSDINTFSCPEAVFEVASSEGHPSEEDVISNHIVTSWVDCGNKCLECVDCVTFSHRAERSHHINCKVSGHASELMVKARDHEDEMWTTYKIIEPEICLTHRQCQNAGRCVKDACQPEGYSCICPQWYLGKYCQNENGNFDVVFTSQHPVLSYIEANNINSDLYQFTFTTWFKISMGLQWYQLLSYMVNGMPGSINLRFETESGNSHVVCYFVGEINTKKVRTNIIPVNDNVWHHIAFAWSNINGRWDVLVDGTARAIRDRVRTGAVIPGDGKLVIGQEYTNSGFMANRGFIGQLSGVNIWDEALTGEELEALATTPNSRQGNILRWFHVLKKIHGHVRIVTSSKVMNTNKGLNFELQFSSDPGQQGYILSPGPEHPMGQLSVCLWIKIDVPSSFVSYDVENEDGPAFSFGIDSNYNLFAFINGRIVKSTIKKEAIVNNHWHFLCLTWDCQTDKLIFYHQGAKIEVKTTNFASISPGGKFLIGATKDEEGGRYIYSGGFVGTLSCLNIWSVELSSTSIYSMSSGAMNINGDYLAWRYVLGKIVDNLAIVPNTVIYYPGYNLLQKRSQWCKDHITSLSCPAMYARLGIGNNRREMLWRCYCSKALVPSKYSYLFSANSTAYETKHDELVAIN